ncbi:MAG: hypothetical protein F4Z66_04135, partial [Gammaproteobacteria bacterium]|nr:hypothetical protein [Gammaproteobacteria bacterium]
MNSPNLFNYATKELSQDAMICWLIAFAGMQSVRNPAEVELRQCGRELLNALFSKWQFTPTVYERVEVFQQEKHIDVLVRINERHVLLIEDKTLTRDHDDQLTRYRNLVTEGKTLLRNVNTDEVFPIYFKTGNHSLREREYAKSCNYRVFDRNDFLSVLESYQGNNEIFVDFRNHLKNWQLETENFRQWTSKGEKTDRGWQGLYRWIEENYLVGCN